MKVSEYIKKVQKMAEKGYVGVDGGIRVEAIEALENKVKQLEQENARLKEDLKTKIRQKSAISRIKSVISRRGQSRIDLRLTGKFANMVCDDAQNIGVRPGNLLRSIIIYNYWMAKMGG
jgi:predicted Holliday junction resolvase-like endonuclease